MGTNGILLPEDVFERGRVERFDEVPVEPGFEAAASVVVSPPAGQRHQVDPAMFGALADGSGDVVAVHQRHPDVEEHDFRQELVDDLQSGLAVVDDTRRRAQQLEHEAEAVRAVLMVIDD